MRRNAKKLNKNRVIVAVLCAAFLIGIPFGSRAESQSAITRSGSSSYQSQIDEINSKLNSLAEERKKLEASIESAQDEIERERAVRSSIDENLRITREEIDELREQIELLELDIEEKQENIVEKQAEIDESFDLFLKRMRVMYMYDDTTMLGLVLGSDSFSEFLTHSDTVVRIAQHDRDLMEYLTSERLLLEAEKTALDDQMTALELSRKEAEDKEADLATQRQAADLRIHDMQQMEKEFLADLEKNKAMQAAMQSELKSIYQRIEWDKNPYVGGEMMWPLPGYYQVSSEYGYRFGGSDFHTGIDLTGGSVYGADIVAANAGTVKYVNWKYTAGRGYGIYLIVDHGGGVTTLYAHCSNIVASVGDVVSAGQKIAEVGSTGWSTGPHLHFEVRIDGNHTNPRPYLFG